MYKKWFLILTLLAITISSQANNLFSQNTQPPFDVQKVIEQNRFGLNRGGSISDAVVTGEFLLDTIPNQRPRTNDQESPAVGFDGTNYLVVWQHKTGSQFNILGCRINQAGVPIDGGGFTICSASKDQKYPAVAFDGENYLVVWQDYRSNSHWDIYGCRITTDGEALDGTNNSGGIIICNFTGDQIKPDVVFGDTTYLVVWDDTRPSIHDIYCNRVKVDGTVLNGSGVRVSNNNGTTPAVAFDGTNFLVAWSNMTPDIYCARVSQTAVVLDPSGIGVSTVSSSQEYPDIAFDGTNYLVVWKDNRNAGIWDIYGSRVSTSGSVIDPSGIQICNATNGQTDVALDFDGTNYFIFWQDDRDFLTTGRNIYGCRVSQNGNVLDASGIAITTAIDTQQVPAVVFGSTNYFVAWQDKRNGSVSKRDIYGSRVGTDGSILDASGILISISANNQQYAAAAFDGTNYLVVWMDSRNTYTTGNDIYGIRVNSSGKTLDTAFPISKASNSQTVPAIAFGSSYYLVVWEDSRNGSSDIYGARINISGIVLDTAGIPISTESEDENDPSIIYGRNRFMVVWEDNRNTATALCDIYGCRIDTSGTVLDLTGIGISMTVDNQYTPCIAFDGTNFLIAWDDRRDAIDYSIYGCRVDTSGIPLEPLGITISTAINNQTDPAIIYDGTNYVVVWSDSRNGVDYDIYGCRVSPAGAVLDPSGVAISIPAEDQVLPDIVFDGSNYFVVWCDYRSGSAFDLYGATVKTSLTVVSTALIVRTQFDNDMYPDLVKGIGQQILLTYYNQADIVDDKAYSADRAWAKIFGSIPVWIASQPMLTQKPGKFVKDGGSMVALNNHEFGPALFAFRGYKSNEFWKFDGLWKSMETIPYGVKPTDPSTINKKKVTKGASLCWDGDSIIYATKGSSTREFWEYNIRQNKWTAKAFVPVPKYLKGGTSIAYRNHKVYLLAGGQKYTDLHNFYIYNPAADTLNGVAWDTLAKAPLGLYVKAWKDGSCITVIRDTIYALKGGDKFNYFWSYGVASTIWKQIESIPQIHPMLGKKNKVGDGAAIATDGRNIYAIKGKGKQDFWIYTPMVRADTGTWVSLETIPKGPLGKKGVPKTGAALAYLEGNVFLLKGNKTDEFWQYIPGFDSITKVSSLDITSAVSTEMLSSVKPTLNIAPNPFTKLAYIKYTVPIFANVSIKLYNTAGRVVQILNEGYLKAGTYTTNLSANALAKGVYFLRYETTNNRKEIKLIVE